MFFCHQFQILSQLSGVDFNFWTGSFHVFFSHKMSSQCIRITPRSLQIGLTSAKRVLLQVQKGRSANRINQQWTCESDCYVNRHQDFGLWVGVLFVKQVICVSSLFFMILRLKHSQFSGSLILEIVYEIQSISWPVRFRSFLSTFFKTKVY